MLVYKKNKSTIYLHVIPVKCGCGFLVLSCGCWQHEKRQSQNRPKPAVETLHPTFSKPIVGFSKKVPRVLSQEIGVSRSTCQRAAKEAGLHAYRFTVVQELKQQDYDKHMTYCRWFQTFIDANP
jgi:hypothetical protein